MNVNITGTMAQLTGNWTRTEMTDRNLDALSQTLQKLKIAGIKRLRIDCEEINEIDDSGLQLLYIWLRFCKFRGVILEIINPPRKLRKTLQGLLIKVCYKDNLLLAGNSNTTPQRTRD